MIYCHLKLIKLLQLNSEIFQIRVRSKEPLKSTKLILVITLKADQFKALECQH